MTTASEYAVLAEASAIHAAQDALSASNSAHNASIAASTSGFNEKYLGAFSVEPVTIVEGSLYWNTVSKSFFVWNGLSWESVITHAFSGNISGGNSATKVDTVKPRIDSSAAWVINNPILLLNEIGFESNTLLYKIGNGSATWNTLPYVQIPKVNVTGIANVDNTSDINKPVSTLQASADTDTLNTAKDYTDSVLTTVFKDKGQYSASTNLFPSTDVVQGDTWIISVPGTLGSIVVVEGDSIRALITTPGQTESNWIIIPSILRVVKPTQFGTFVQGVPISNQLLGYFSTTYTVFFKTNFEGSVARCSQRPLADVNVLITKNGITIGNLLFTNITNVGVFTSSSTQTITKDDSIELVFPTIQDLSIADISITLQGYS